RTLSPDGWAGHFINDGGGAAVYARTSANVTAGTHAIEGVVNGGSGLLFTSGVRGSNNGTNASSYGVWGDHTGSGIGVYGVSSSGNGVEGEANGNSGNKAVYGH